MPHPAPFTWPWLIEQFSNPLVLFGFAAQFVFFLRFAVQWLASERAGRSTIPISFWYLSLVGGLMTLVYAIKRADIVFAFAQFLSIFIYVRNLMLIHRERRRLRGFPVVAEPLPSAAMADQGESAGR